MRREQFIEAVLKSGWKDTADAQHKGIEKLWRQIFPEVAQLEDEIDRLVNGLYKYGVHTNKCAHNRASGGHCICGLTELIEG